MTKLFTIALFSLLTVLSSAQEVKVEKKNNTYEFSHSENYSYEKIQRIEFRIKEENKSIDKVEIKNDKVLILFKENSTDEQIEKSIYYCITIFNYNSFKIKE